MTMESLKVIDGQENSATEATLTEVKANLADAFFDS